MRALPASIYRNNHDVFPSADLRRYSPALSLNVLAGSIASMRVAVKTLLFMVSLSADSASLPLRIIIQMISRFYRISPYGVKHYFFEKCRWNGHKSDVI